MYKINRLLKN